MRYIGCARPLTLLLLRRFQAEVLSVVSCPTAMVCKWITNLLEQQRQAKRITEGQVRPTPLRLAPRRRGLNTV
jgi:hypothetical protein